MYKENQDKVFDFIGACAASDITAQKEESFDKKSDGKPLSRAVGMFFELSFMKPSKRFTAIEGYTGDLKPHTRKYIEDDFRSNARDFFQDIAEKIEQGNERYHNNPNLLTLMHATTLGDDNNQARLNAVNVITCYGHEQRSQIPNQTLAYQILMSEFWENKICKEAFSKVESGEKDIDCFTQNKGSIIDLTPQDVMSRKKRRPQTAPPAPRPKRVHLVALEEMGPDIGPHL